MWLGLVRELRRCAGEERASLASTVVGLGRRTQVGQTHACRPAATTRPEQPNTVEPGLRESARGICP